MKRHGHGIASLLLVAGALTVALTVIWRQSFVWGLAYLVLLTGGSGVILFAFCAKCPCRLQGCGHIIPGSLTRIFPARRQGPYRGLDYLGVIVPLILFVGVPQFWLSHNLTAMMLFWLLLAAGGIDILVHVCKGCDNHRCPIRMIRN